MQAFGVGSRFCWVLRKSKEAQRLNSAEKKASWGDTSGEPVETSADSKVFLMSLHHRAKRCPGVRIRTKTKFEKKPNLHLLQGSCIYSSCGRHAHLSAHIFWGIYSDFALHHTHLERSSLILTCHECCDCGSLRFSNRTETSPFTTVSTGIARKEVWCLLHSHSPSCPSPFKHQGGKKGGENYQVFLTSTEKSHSKSPLVSLGCLLEYITPLHTGTYTHVHSFMELIRKKYFNDHNFL